MALGYLLGPILALIPGEKAMYGLGALFGGIILFFLHMIGPTRGPLAELVSGLIERTFRGHTSLMRRHLRLQHG